MPLRSELLTPQIVGVFHLEPGAPITPQVPHKLPSIISDGAAANPSGPANAATYADVNFFLAICQPDDAVGNLVYAHTDADGVTTADCSSNLPVIGVIVRKSDDSHCTVQTFGLVRGLYADLVPGQTYFLGHGTPIAPPFDNTVQFVQQVGNAVDSVTLYLRLSGSAIKRDTGNG